MGTFATFVLAVSQPAEWYAALRPLFSSVEMVILAIVVVMLLWETMGLRYINNNYVGIVEKLWSRSGSVAEGSIIGTRESA